MDYDWNKNHWLNTTMWFFFSMFLLLFECHWMIAIRRQLVEVKKNDKILKMFIHLIKHIGTTCDMTNHRNTPKKNYWNKWKRRNQKRSANRCNYHKQMDMGSEEKMKRERKNWLWQCHSFLFQCTKGFAEYTHPKQ